MSEVVQLTQELIRFNTVNPPGNEAPAIHHLGDRLTKAGLEVTYQDLSDTRANLIARLPGMGSGPGHLVLCGHIDVVHPGASAWEHDPFAADIVEDRLVGRGAADMKGGVAAMSEAILHLHSAGFKPSSDLIVAVTAGEEVDMAGAKLLGSSGILEGATSVVIGEPTGLNVYRAEKGVLWPRITARGKTAHGSMPHLGVNAISFIARLIERLESYPFPYESNSLLGDPTLSVNVITGGVKTNVVADECTVEVDMRLVPGQARDAVLGILDGIIDDLRSQFPVTTEVTLMQDAPALETREDSALVNAMTGAVESVLGRTPETGGVAYGTDGAFIAPKLAADMVICGPGRLDQLHQPNEWVSCDELEEAVDVYVQLAQYLLG